MGGVTRQRRPRSRALEDLIPAAYNDAAQKVDRTVQDKMGGLTGGLGLPAGMKLPF